MDLVVGEPRVTRKRERAKSVAAAGPAAVGEEEARMLLFHDKVHALLLRTRGAMSACPGSEDDPSFSVLDDLEAFADLTSVAAVVKKLGGKQSLAASL